MKCYHLSQKKNLLGTIWKSIRLEKDGFQMIIELPIELTIAFF